MVYPHQAGEDGRGIHILFPASSHWGLLTVNSALVQALSLVNYNCYILFLRSVMSPVAEVRSILYVKLASLVSLEKLLSLIYLQ